MARLIFITHPEVAVRPDLDVRRWRLSEAGTARMRVFADSAVVRDVSAIWASTEAKAIEAAGLLAAGLGLGVRVDPALGENDRSATGFLPPEEFEAMADAFFARPEDSVRGWERAVDAQARICGAVDRLVQGHGGDGDLAIVAHGAVGTLLACAWGNRAIGRDADQPFQGHYWTADLPAPDAPPNRPTPWQPIAPRLAPGAARST